VIPKLHRRALVAPKRQGVLWNNAIPLQRPIAYRHAIILNEPSSQCVVEDMKATVKRKISIREASTEYDSEALTVLALHGSIQRLPRYANCQLQCSHWNDPRAKTKMWLDKESNLELWCDSPWGQRINQHGTRTHSLPLGLEIGGGRSTIEPIGLTRLIAEKGINLSGHWRISSGSKVGVRIFEKWGVNWSLISRITLIWDWTSMHL
jgi:hypothetical protein